jgi:cytosine deaminase
VEAHIHLDLGDDPERLHVRHVLEATLRHGRQGRVAVLHLTERAALPPGEQEALARDLAAAGVGVIVRAPAPASPGAGSPGTPAPGGLDSGGERR